MRRLPRILAAVLLAATATGLAGCATGTGASPAAVVVRIAPSAHPVDDLEVHVAQVHGPYRAVQRMRSGETRRFPVPAGWVTVRIPGVCVVPAENSGTAVVVVDQDACHLA